MGRGQSQFQVSGFCYRLFNFLVDFLIVRGLKRVTLGHPLDHGLTQGLVSGSPRNGAGSREDNHVDSIKHSEEEKEEGMHTLVHRKPKNDVDLLVKVEFDKANGLDNLAPVAARGSSIHVSKEGSAIVGGSQTQVHKMVTVRPNSLFEIQEKTDPQAPLEQAKVRDMGSQKEVVVPNVKSQARGLKKIVSIKDGAKKRETLDKGKSILGKEKLALAIEPEKDAYVNAPTSLRSSIRVALNIDEQSDELIRRTREALRISSDIEPVTP